IPSGFRCRLRKGRTEGKRQHKYGAIFTGTLDADLATVISNHFLSDGQAQSCAIFLTITDEWRKNCFRNSRWDPGSIVRDSDHDSFRPPLEDSNLDYSRLGRDRLTGVQ